MRMEIEMFFCAGILGKEIECDNIFAVSTYLIPGRGILVIPFVYSFTFMGLIFLWLRF